MKYRKTLIPFAWWRSFLGFCPQCNSSAPELYDCPVCKHDTTSPHDKAKRKEYWENYNLLERSDFETVHCEIWGEENDGGKFHEHYETQFFKMDNVFRDIKRELGIDKYKCILFGYRWYDYEMNVMYAPDGSEKQA